MAKVAELSQPLTMDGVPAGDDPDINDIGYYAPAQNLVFYYGDVGYWNGIVRIGQLNDNHTDIDLIRRTTRRFHRHHRTGLVTVARILITGSADGLGRRTAQTLLHAGHQVIVHARSVERLAAVNDLLDEGATAVVGDLSDHDQTRALADQVNQLGRADAAIHNTSVYNGPQVLPVNIVAPYLLTALLRLVYLSSGMHSGGRAQVSDLKWSGHHGPGSYSDSKLFVTTLAVAIARLWPDVRSNAVDPGWVPTKMGGPNAPDELRLGHLTQEWLATSPDPAAVTTGGFTIRRLS